VKTTVVTGVIVTVRSTASVCVSEKVPVVKSLVVVKVKADSVNSKLEQY
jgi:hypothetical protein